MTTPAWPDLQVNVSYLARLEAARRIRLFLTGPTGSATYDADSFNARSVAERARGRDAGIAIRRVGDRAYRRL